MMHLCSENMLRKRDIYASSDSSIDQGQIVASFPDEQLFHVKRLPWFADIINFLVTREYPAHWNRNERDRFFAQVKHYFWEEPELFRSCPDQMIRRCVPEEEYHSILSFCQS